MLRHPGFEGLTCFSKAFGIKSFAYKLEDHARLCILGDGVFGFHQGSSEGGRRPVCHCDVVVSEVSGCPSRFAVLVVPLVIRRCFGGLFFPLSLLSRNFV